MPLPALTKQLIFIVACVVVFALLQGFEPQLKYIDTLIPAQPWRLITAHWVHLGWRHYLLNMLAFLFLPLVFPHIRICSLIACLVLLPVFISLCFYQWLPGLHSYVGLSGVLHGMYVLAALQSALRAGERKFAVMVLCLIALKLLWEKLFGSESEAFLQAPVVIEAHQFGAAGGIILAVICYVCCQLKRTRA